MDDVINDVDRKRMRHHRDSLWAWRMVAVTVPPGHEARPDWPGIPARMRAAVSIEAQALCKSDSCRDFP